MSLADTLRKPLAGNNPSLVALANNVHFLSDSLLDSKHFRNRLLASIGKIHQNQGGCGAAAPELLFSTGKSRFKKPTTVLGLFLRPPRFEIGISILFLLLRRLTLCLVST